MARQDTISTQGYVTGVQLWLTVGVCAMGYFVDIYDLILFSIVRLESLHAIGVMPADILSASELILNSQMVGMLLGGILFGVLADKRGRMSMLMGSILLYSTMNIANAFVTSVPAYAALRFFSGIGLAGELGVAITLVTEVMRKESRGYGTTLVATMGILGAVVAYGVHSTFNWRIAFIAGGVLGLLLLVLRVRVHDSTMFKRAEQQAVSRGNFFMLFTPKRLGLYASCIAIGLPVWYVIGILVTFSSEFARERGVSAAVVPGLSVMWAYVGLAFGDLASGLFSQALRSRKKVVLAYILATAGLVTWFITSSDPNPGTVYWQCGLLGLATGYWAVFVTTAAEQFGTNLRATVATTVPNFVRGGLVPALVLFHLFRDWPNAAEGWFGIHGRPLATAALFVGAITMVIAIAGWVFLKETYGRDLDYVEV